MTKTYLTRNSVRDKEKISAVLDKFFQKIPKKEIELIVKAGIKRIADMNNDISDDVFQTLNLAGFLKPVEEEEEEDDEDVRLFDITKKMEELVKA